MSEYITIRKHKEPSEELGYDALRSVGIDVAQQISGNVWTDYNYHDPGVTILEQLSYALTEVVYRSNFAVEDLLLSKDGEIHWREQALLPPEVAFSSRPCTELDYRRVILDEFNELEDVRFELIPGEDQAPTGLYRVVLRFADQWLHQTSNTSEAQAARKSKTQIADRVYWFYCKLRNLCEDIQVFVFETTAEYRPQAEVQITDKADAITVLAKIYLACEEWISSGIDFLSYPRALERRMSAEEIFRGPLVRSGIVERNRNQTRSSVASADLYRLLKSVEGVESVKVEDQQHAQQVAPESVLRMHWPTSDEEIGIHIFRNRREQKVRLHDLMMRSREIRYAKQSLKPDQCDNVIPLPKGKRRELEEYSSLQFQFPAIYGLGESGIPDYLNAREKARIQQLRGYITLFDQLIADQLASVADLHRLYSTTIRPHETYSLFRLNSRNVPWIDTVFDNTQLDGWRQSGMRQDATMRARRLSDYLLALYGERFQDEPLLEAAQGGDSQRMHTLIHARLECLKEIDALTRDRGAAMDYLRQDGSSIPRGGFEVKLSHYLGMEQHFKKTGQGLRVFEHILLRPSNFKNAELSKFTFRISVLMPAWIDMCSGEGFRDYAAQLVDRLAPAHVYADIYWLALEEMMEFEVLLSAWLAEPRKHETTHLLLELLRNHESMQKNSGGR